MVVSTYNEPLITSEWAVAIFKQARQAGLMTAYVSNGNGTPRVLDYIRPWVDLYKVDLKSFDDKHYRQLGGRIEPILATIRALHAAGIWIELVTLLIPGFNDSPDELDRVTSFIASVSPDIPWHVTAFHKDYRMNDPENTTPEMLVQAAETGSATGCDMSTPATFPAASATSNTPAAMSAARCWSSGLAISFSSIVSRPTGVARSARHRSPAGGARPSPDRSPRRRSFPARDGCVHCEPQDLRRRPGVHELIGQTVFASPQP